MTHVYMYSMIYGHYLLIENVLTIKIKGIRKLQLHLSLVIAFAKQRSSTWENIVF